MARKPGGSKSRRKTETHGGGGPPPGAGFTVRHYCQGIGDCHLLSFPREDGDSYFILIDCGVHAGVSGGADKIREVVADIATVTKRVDLLVVTHEHWDHVSGFVGAAEAFEIDRPSARPRPPPDRGARARDGSRYDTR